MRVRTRYAVAIRQYKFLNPLPRIDLAGVEIATRIHGDGVNPMELARHTAIVPDRTGEFSSLAFVNPNFVISAIRDQHVFCSAS
jgi:hypothetical protein